MLRSVLEAQGPAKQNATDTIQTLCSRLANASLLEDRRAAILGLRSFAKEYPASVASGSLRGLISTLNKDLEDVDTTKVILETILLLFNPNDESLEASDEISFWLADEFTQRQDNVKALLDLLESPDFYSRLYPMQILSAISGLRPERLQDSVLAAPLGTSRLVAVLDDPREAVRSAALLLLGDLTLHSTDIQNLVAFENAFERIFNLIMAEGKISEGGVVVQDCLTLLANLLQGNVSNQSLFRESGFSATVAKIFIEDNRNSGDDGEVVPIQHSEGRNIWGLITVIRMFLIDGTVGLQANQVAFEKHGILQSLLDLSFDDTRELRNRAAALRACGDIIKGNNKLQERFWQHQVSYSHQEPMRERSGSGDEFTKVYIIDGLLELALIYAPSSMLDLRYAASECIRAYFWGHTQLRLDFLKRTIDIRANTESEACNVVNILMEQPRQADNTDSYRIWFAAVITLSLFLGDPDAKSILMAVKEGNESNGEEVVTCIQVLTGNLILAIQSGKDTRISCAYLMLLSMWLFEDAAAVNDLLEEGSAIQSLTSTISSRKGTSGGLVEGLAAFLLGILYEFSTKDSPIPRRKLHGLIISCRDNYNRTLEELRVHPYIRDFEVNLGVSSELYFDRAFVEFFKDNFSRIKRAIDRDPGLEVVGVLEGVDRDLLDSLKVQIAEKDATFLKERASFQTALGTAKTELDRTQYANNTLQAQISELEKALESSRMKEDKHEQDLNKLRSQNLALESGLQAKATQIRELQDKTEEQAQRLSSSDARAIGLQKAFDAKDIDLKQAKRSLDEITANHSQSSTALERLTVAYKGLESKLNEHVEKLAAAEETAKAKEVERESTQAELDDLLIVLGDLEERRAKDRARFIALGVETSDYDDGDGEDNEDSSTEDDVD